MNNISNYNKILVIGFQHSGTSILRKIIGNHSQVYDVVNEAQSIPKREFKNILNDKNATSIVIKTPFWNNISNVDDLINKYNGFKIVFILKNYLDIYASLKMRFSINTKEYISTKWLINNSLQNWDKVAKIFFNIADNPNKYPQIFIVKYEDLFSICPLSEEKNLWKLLFKFLELPFEIDCITKNQKRQIPINNVLTHGDQPMPSRKEQRKFRSWQINQPVTNMTGINRHTLSIEEINGLKKDSIILDKYFKKSISYYQK